MLNKMIITRSSSINAIKLHAYVAHSGNAYKTGQYDT